jgi:hypothetical protein
MTPTPSDTPTPSNTPTPSDTPTATNTSTPTYTPSNTPTASNTPTWTPTPTDTPTATNTPTVTPTPRIICQIFSRQNVNARTAPSLEAGILSTIPSGTVMDVLGQERNPTDGRRWFLVEATIGNGSRITGAYVRDDTNFIAQFPNNLCPALTQ